MSKDKRVECDGDNAIGSQLETTPVQNRKEISNMSKDKRVECGDDNAIGSKFAPSCVPPDVKNVTHPLRYYEFTREEIKALEECDKESFYQRCLPFSTLFAGSTYAAVRYGYFKPNPRFGAIPKISFAVLAGYFIGKLSYQQACAEKLMALPGSYIGKLLRDKRDGRVGESGNMKGTATMFGAGPSDIYSDAGPGSSLDLDTDRPIFSDDSYRSDEGGGSPPLDPGSKRPALSYDDLRRRNRGEYTEARQDPYRMDPNTVPSVRRAPAPEPPAAAPGAPASARSTNKYGDVMD